MDITYEIFPNIIKKYINSSDYEDYITVSYLHDTLEDTNTTFEELISIFGLKIAYLVKELTNDPDIKENLGKTKYLSIKMKNMDDKALTIKLCDRLDSGDFKLTAEMISNVLGFTPIAEANYVVGIILDDEEEIETQE